MWKLKIGDKVTWTTTGHGNIQRSGKIVALVPAGMAADSVATPLARGLKNESQYDRYAVEVPKINSRGNPAQDGATVIMLPNRWMLEEKAIVGGASVVC